VLIKTQHHDVFYSPRNYAVKLAFQEVLSRLVKNVHLFLQQEVGRSYLPFIHENEVEDILGETRIKSLSVISAGAFFCK
jgi:hypothetical protein